MWIGEEVKNSRRLGICGLEDRNSIEKLTIHGDMELQRKKKEKKKKSWRERESQSRVYEKRQEGNKEEKRRE